MTCTLRALAADARWVQAADRLHPYHATKELSA